MRRCLDRSAHGPWHIQETGTPEQGGLPVLAYCQNCGLTVPVMWWVA